MCGFLISGFNTMSRKKKEKYDEGAVCRAHGKLLLLVCGFLAFMPVALYFEIWWLIYVLIGVIVLITVVFTVYFRTGNRFVKAGWTENQGADGADAPNPPTYIGRRKIIAVIISTVIFLGLVGGLVGGLVVYGAKEPEITIEQTSFRISGMYGRTVEFSGVVGIDLTEKSMREIDGNLRRRNGYSGVDVLKGHFTLSSSAYVLLFVSAGTAPTIRIRRGSMDNDIFISLSDGATTRELYDNLKTAFESGKAQGLF
jgi:hypothetical protein